MSRSPEQPALPRTETEGEAAGGYKGGAGSEGASPSASRWAAAPTVYVKWRTTTVIDGLSITVDSLEEKLDTDGRELLLVEITARAGAASQQLSFRGEGAAHRVFAGHWIQCRGGSRQAVGFAVIRAPAP